MRRRLLFITHRIPYPPNKGDKIRSFHILKHLSECYDVILACMVDDPSDIQGIERLSAHTKLVIFEKIHPRIKKTLSIPALLNGEPISNRYFYSKKLQQKIDHVLSKMDIDAVLCFSSPTAEYVFRSRHYSNRLANTSCFMDFIDVDSYKWRQYAETKPFPFNWIFAREAVTLRCCEKHIADKFAHVFFVSEAEKNLFMNYVGTSSNATAISNGVDMDFFSPMQMAKHKEQTLLFTGAMDYWPNIDGVVWFSDTVLPAVQEVFPDVHFYIVGRNPAKQVRDLNRRSGITVTGFVDDVRIFMSKAHLSVIPLRIARGIQNKVLEAMAMEMPIVCTPQAVDGIDASPGREVVVAENPEVFSKQIQILLNDKQNAQKMGQQARQKVSSHYAWQACLEPLTNILESGSNKL